MHERADPESGRNGSEPGERHLRLVESAAEAEARQYLNWLMTQEEAQYPGEPRNYELLESERPKLREIHDDFPVLYDGLFAPWARAQPFLGWPQLHAKIQAEARPQRALKGLEPQSATELLAKTFPPLRCFVDEILAEGLTILAGKPKKGKSYLALDMSLAIACGREAFRKFRTEQATVLYVALEDGERRLQRRLRQIQPNLATPPNLDFLYDFPRLGEGALEALTGFIEQYPVIILDTIGRLLPPQTPQRKSLSEYQELTDVLGPIQKLAGKKRSAIVLIDHLRKAGAEDVGDMIMGSQGKFGSADHALIYTRKGQEKDGVLEVLGRDLDPEKFILSLTEGHLEFLGKGEIYELDSQQNRILKILEEDHRPLSVPDLMKALEIPEAHYGRFRQVMQRLYNEDRVGRTKRGLFTLYGHDRYNDDVPF